ncbi:hypothetical protein M0813_07290 [Anaeramoeba flamelloides]|uniref:Uncharacterized protein n=1 Tax=Anaeramoeba flamelloides TaxID=1746091 RepID=A0AAV7Z009_9EUKA|nr:hypothetical protein M0812_19862 [Anaeramoeba flamelloides]KAJ6230065.1 hypothetical protein M0813_07290 [Anaeramoeba flamelloides]|eukprot:Anaeramoba_flamelloidesa822479_38.p1 GENE.a822479_38~~a822479_38.p1  ORF type:complete len:329 (-),score=73.49 a822479_38:37-987(-)
MRNQTRSTNYLIVLILIITITTTHCQNKEEKGSDDSKTYFSKKFLDSKIVKELNTIGFLASLKNEKSFEVVNLLLELEFEKAFLLMEKMDDDAIYQILQRAKEAYYFIHMACLSIENEFFTDQVQQNGKCDSGWFQANKTDHKLAQVPLSERKKQSCLGLTKNGLIAMSSLKVDKLKTNLKKGLSRRNGRQSKNYTLPEQSCKKINTFGNEKIPQNKVFWVVKDLINGNYKHAKAVAQELIPRRRLHVFALLPHTFETLLFFCESSSDPFHPLQFSCNESLSTNGVIFYSRMLLMMTQDDLVRSMTEEIQEKKNKT